MAKPSSKSFRIRLARLEEADYLTGLAMRSKAHWGYADDLLLAWENDMRVDPGYCAAGNVWILENEGTILGFAELIAEGTTARLDDLWIEPTHMRHGYGAALFKHLVTIAKSNGVTRIMLDAEPNSIDFYEKMGARIIGELKSSEVPDRVLPVMQLDL